MNKRYMIEIAEALSENHAALMVGAGFSKNAEKISITDKRFLNWNELSDMFYEMVYGKNDKQGKEYNNSLRLAQEVEVAFGRPKLEEIIREAVPDLEYAPSNLYVKLMEMPWKDIFTTNYDTLLERTTVKVTKRRYNVVVCQEDLINSNDASRILKLHGSFPSYRPFIVTEEDYRTYPIKFAAMVNTVQQALLENVFCMLGFSCEDPNFINWIGWIHDNLGKSSSQKIYMVSVSHIAEVKRKLLLERNIVVVDLEELWPEKNIAERLNAFLEILQSKIEEKKKKDNWFNFGGIDIGYDTAFVDKTAAMKVLNDSYPGCIFLPWKMKNKVRYLLDNLEYQKGFEDIAFHDQINYMFEYVKLMDISGRPLLSQIVEQFWDVLEKVNGNDQIKKSENKLEHKIQVVYLQLLRAYRELAEWEKYDICHEKINCEYLDYENKQFMYSCDWWKNLFRFQSENLVELLDMWSLAKGDVYWPLIKASSYALIGETSKAEETLSETLSLVRSQLVKVNENEYLSSIEESIVSLINFIRQAECSNNLEECIHEGDVSWWNENDKYCLHLNSEAKDNKEFEKKDNFDLSSTYTTYMGNDNANVFYALEYLRFLEKTGHSFRLQNVTNTKGLHSTVKKLAPYYSHWCLMQILIAQDIKHIDYLFGRVKLSELSREDVDIVMKEYLRVLKIVMKNVKPHNFYNAKSIYEQAAVVLPDIISRLCYKCSVNMFDEIMDITLDLCVSNIRTNFKGIAKIFRGVLQGLSIQEQKKWIVKILEFPMETDRFSDYYDPMRYISKPKKKYRLDIDVYNKVLFQIKQTINGNQDEKKDVAINRFVILAQVIILNTEDEKYLRSVLEQEDSTINKALLYMLYKNKYKSNVKEIFEKTLSQMKRDSDVKTFSVGSNNYRDLINILKELDIEDINIKESFEVMENLVKTNMFWVRSKRAEAEERIRQSFMVAVGLLALQYNSDMVLGKQEKEKIVEYFVALKELYKKETVIDMILVGFVGYIDISFENLQKNIWLCDEQEISLLKDFYEILHVNHFRLAQNEKFINCANIIFKVMAYRMVSGEFSKIRQMLELCYALLQNEILLESELQILNAGLAKFIDITCICKDDSEQEALYKLKCRIKACQIARALYMRGIKSESVDQWKMISLNENEFIEIRNIIFDKDGAVSGGD